jgi:hypothetical protein
MEKMSARAVVVTKLSRHVLNDRAPLTCARLHPHAYRA